MRVLVTGANGLCGSAIMEESQNSQHDFLFRTRKDCNLLNEYDVRKMIADAKPDVVIHTAAKVGGIGANLSYPADFFYENMKMNMNIIHHSYDLGVKKLLVFSSVCVFPDSLPYLKEDKMHDGPVYHANAAYGYAKRMVDVYIQALQQQYGVTNYCSVIPGNIFGKHDNFNLKNSHIVPALIHKLYLAKINNSKFRIWGNGSSMREFIYVNDLAKVILKLVDMPEIPSRVIVSGKYEFSIKDIVDALVHISDFNGEVVYDTSKPNGQYRRPSDKTVFDSYFPNFEYTDIYDGLKYTWEWFAANYKDVRK